MLAFEQKAMTQDAGAGAHMVGSSMARVVAAASLNR